MMPHSNVYSQQKFMAYEGLLAWAECSIQQSHNLSPVRQRYIMSPGTPMEIRALNIRAASHVFQCTRHIFLLAANNFFAYRKWVKKLRLIDDSFFADIDIYWSIVKELRDMNEHVIDYYSGEGKNPDYWIYDDENFGTADASSTVETRIGNILDWVKFSEAANKLLAQLYSIEPDIRKKIAEEYAGSD